jgi:putative ABC transport system permease protein
MAVLGPRWRKVLADLWSNRLRTALVVLSIAAGVFAVGLISGGFVILLRDLDADYQSATPAVATILTEPFNDDAVKAAERVPGVALAEGRSQMTARLYRAGVEPLAVRIVSIPDPARMRIDKLRPAQPGATLNLKNKELLFERSGLGQLPVKPGDAVTLKMPDRDPGGDGTAGPLQTERTLRVADIVHDVTIEPSTMSGELNVYVNADTMEWLGRSHDFDWLLITVKDRPRDEAHVRAVAKDVAHTIEHGDRRVLATLVSHPGEHPNAFVIRALLVLLVGLGGLCVLLSGFLVATTINALLGQQVRQIGVMKAVGARTDQITGMYIALVLSFGAMALLLAAAPAALAAYWATGLVAKFLNFDRGPFHLPAEALTLQITVALAVPFLSALPAVLGGAAMTVRHAIQHHGLGQNPQRERPLHGILQRIQILPRPARVSLRNTFRRKGRLVLTLATLTLAGAIFIAVFNIRASFAGTINDTLGYFLANVNVNLNRAYRTQQIEQIVAAVPGVAHVESWGIAPGQLLAADQKTGSAVVIFAPPAGSKLVKPVLTAGRWLQPGDRDAIVIGNQITSKRPDLRVGDSITTKILGKKYTWTVVGVFKMAGNVSQPLLYADFDYLTQTLNQTGRAGTYHIVTDSQDSAGEERVAQALDSRLRSAGVQVAGITTGSAQRTEEHSGIDILVYFLIGIAVLIALVGGLGLMGTMSMNVMERTHEIGIMRAIGATNGHIIRLVILEGVLIGALSWLFGAALALPVSKAFSDLLGQAIVATPLNLTFTPLGFGLWLAAVLGLSALASLLPAYRAARLTVREVLAYE